MFGLEAGRRSLYMGFLMTHFLTLLLTHISPAQAIPQGYSAIFRTFFYTWLPSCIHTVSCAASPSSSQSSSPYIFLKKISLPSNRSSSFCQDNVIYYKTSRQTCYTAMVSISIGANLDVTFFIDISLHCSAAAANGREWGNGIKASINWVV